MTKEHKEETLQKIRRNAREELADITNFVEALNKEFSKEFVGTSYVNEKTRKIVSRVEAIKRHLDTLREFEKARVLEDN